MNIRKVITGHDVHGNSMIDVDENVSETIRIPDVPGWEYATVALTPADFVLPSITPPAPVDVGLSPGATQFAMWRLPPVENGANPAGMHATDTVDYIFIVEGGVSMIMDDGSEVELRQGDCVVQNGTRHEWVNRTSEDCLMAVVMVGVGRS